jgi:hypothetical protein
MTSVERSVDGSLSLSHRKSPWRALAQQSDEDIAFKRRVGLNKACVIRTRPIWLAKFPGDFSVDDMLEIADQVVVGAYDEDAAADKRGAFYTDIVDTRKYGADPSAMFVGLAAANTILEALVPSTEDAIPDADDDEALDPEV